jgi:hypothetical protein
MERYLREFLKKAEKNQIEVEGTYKVHNLNPDDMDFCVR